MQGFKSLELRITQQGVDLYNSTSAADGPGTTGPHISLLKKSLLIQVMKKKRLEFCNRHKSWIAEDWESVVLSDESCFGVLRIAGVHEDLTAFITSSPSRQ